MNKEDKNKVLRNLAMIKRAVEEFDMDVDSYDSLDEISEDAWNVIYDKVEYDRIDTDAELHQRRCCGGGQYLSWNDGKGYDFWSDGEIINYDCLQWWRFDEATGEYHTIKDYEANEEEDFIETDTVIDSEGQKVLLLVKYSSIH